MFYNDVCNDFSIKLVFKNLQILIADASSIYLHLFYAIHSPEHYYLHLFSPCDRLEPLIFHILV